MIPCDHSRWTSEKSNFIIRVPKQKKKQKKKRCFFCHSPYTHHVPRTNAHLTGRRRPRPSMVRPRVKLRRRHARVFVGGTGNINTRWDEKFDASAKSLPISTANKIPCFLGREVLASC